MQIKKKTNFGYQNNTTGREKDIKLKMCQIQKDLDRTISNENNFQNKFYSFNMEQFRIKKLVSKAIEN